MPAVTSPTTSLSNSVFSSPKRSSTNATTLPPRVAFGSSAVRMPAAPGSVAIVVRRSMFAGDTSKSSPVATAAPPLKSFITAATSTRTGAGARCGSGLGMNVPSVRSLVMKYCDAMRVASAAVAAMMRLRRSKPSRQSPSATYSDSAMPTRCGSFSVCVKPRSQMFFARSISASVNGCDGTPSIVAIIASRAGSIGWSDFSCAPKYAKPGSAIARAAPNTPAARFFSTSALLSRNSGPPSMMPASVAAAKSGDEPAGR